MLKKGSTILSKKLFILTIEGGVVFWLTTIAISLLPVAAEYRFCLFKSEYSNGLGCFFACWFDYRMLR